MNEQTEKIMEEIQQGVSLSEIARNYGISRQRVHQIKNRIGKPLKVRKVKEKKPTKKEIKARLDAEARENLRLYEETQKHKQIEWNEKLPLAFSKIRNVLNGVFGNLLTLLRFEHVDDSGYWFTFELVNDNRRQTYRVGHDEIS